MLETGNSEVLGERPVPTQIRPRQICNGLDQCRIRASEVDILNHGMALTLWRLTTYTYICRTAQLTSRRCILNIYSKNVLTEYFKHAAHSPFCFSIQDAVYFIMLSVLVPVIFTF